MWSSLGAHASSYSYSYHSQYSFTNHTKQFSYLKPSRSLRLQATHDNKEENEGDNGVTMEVSPTVLNVLNKKSLENEPSQDKEGLSLIEKNALKRAAKFNAMKLSTIKNVDNSATKQPSDCNSLIESFKYGFPRVQRPGKLDLDIALSFAQKYLGFDFIIPNQTISFGKPIDDALIKDCLPSVFLSATLRKTGGLRFEKEKSYYSEKLVVYILYNHLVKKMREDIDNGREKTAAEAATLLGKLDPLVKTVISPELLVLHAFEKSGFVSDKRIGRFEDGFLFPGKLDEEKDPKDTLCQVQQYLDITGQDNVAFLLKSGEEKCICLVAPWSWMMASILPNEVYNLVSLISFVFSMGFLLQFGHADPGYASFVWEALLVPLGFSGLVGVSWITRWYVAKKYNVGELLRWPVVFPFPGLGAIGCVTSYKGCLPNRDCLLNLSLASVLSCVFVSSLACLIGYQMGIEHVFASRDSVSFYGFFLVPSSMFEFSEFFSFLLKRLSLATFLDESQGLEYVVSPVELCGLIGLCFSCFNLVPLKRFDGVRILSAVLGREKASGLSVVLQCLATGGVFVKSPFLGFSLLGYLFFSQRYDDLFQREEVSEPSVLGKFAGLSMVIAALATFVPAFSL